MMITCKECKKENRTIARFCKKCGSAFAITASAGNAQPTDELDSLVGLDDMKAVFRKELNIAVLSRRLNPAAVIRNLDTILTGDTGTGKTRVAYVLTRLLFQNGLVKKPEPTFVPAAEFGVFVSKLSANLDAAKGTVLFIDHADQLVPEDYVAGQSTMLDRLYAEMDKRQGDPIIILAARDSSFIKYLQTNPHVNSRFYLKFALPSYSLLQMEDMTLALLRKKQFSSSTEFEARLRARLNYLFRAQQQPEMVFHNGKNAFLVEKEVSRITGDFLLRSQGDLQIPLDESDIKGEVFVSKSPDEVLAALDDLVGMRAVKDFLSDLVRRLEIQKRDSSLSKKSVSWGVHLVLTGNPGTGKTTLAEKLGELFGASGLLSSGHTVSATRAELVGQYIGETAKLVNQLCDRAMGGVLFVDEAYMLKQDDNDRFGQEAIDTLMTRMENDRGKFVMIAAGYQEEMLRFIEANPGMKSRLNGQIFHLKDYTGAELLEILNVFCRIGGYQLMPEAEKKAASILEEKTRIKFKGFGNARDVRNLLDTVLTNRARRLSLGSEIDYDLFLHPDDFPGQETDTSDANIDQILAELNALTGLNRVKEEIARMIGKVKANKLRMQADIRAVGFGDHFIFTGNPGTGKTTVARLVAKIFYALRVLPTDKVVEVIAKDLVSGFIGQTARDTDDKIEKAMGGVLFIDEAYTLTVKPGSNANYNSEAVDTLLKRMEDDRGKFIVIAAGYTKEMEEFLESNPGLPSRFTNVINFEDYNDAELESILRNMLISEGYVLEASADKQVGILAERIYRSRGKAFGNARRMRSEAAVILGRQGERILRLSGEGAAFDARLIVREDITGPEVDPQARQRQILASLKKLNAMTGLTAVKKEIGRMINFMAIEKLRSEQQGRPMDLLNNHFIFKGNPGTGKTTVARLLADIFKSIGVLEKGQLVEADRQKLVGQYVGGTEKQTDKVITSALGGVLFIDEAYTLAPRGAQSDFGQVAIEILLKRMEDERGNLIVIAAGYAEDMDRFVASNDGLASRFSKEIVFEDYQPDELFDIFLSMLADKNMQLDSGAQQATQSYFGQLYATRDNRFANGRTVRNVYQKALERQADRLATLQMQGEDVSEKLQTIIIEDIIS